MDKKLQREMILTIKTINDEKGILYNQILFDIEKKFKELGYSGASITANLYLLNEMGLINGFEKEWIYPHGPSIHLTTLGHNSLKPWFKKSFDIKNVSTLGNLILLLINILLGILNIIFFKR